MKNDAFMILIVLAVAATRAQASYIYFPALPSPLGGTVDGCTNCLFSAASVPAGAVGDTLLWWSFDAANTNPVVRVIFNSSGKVIGWGASVTPVGTGVQTALFALQVGTDILGAGDTVGVYYAGAASIPFGSGGPAVVYKPLGTGEQLALNTQVTTSAGNRAYDVSYVAADQVPLGPPSTPPDANATTDGATSAYYAYTPVTSQYNGDVLT